jgi:hypothetical protein
MQMLEMIWPHIQEESAKDVDKDESLSDDGSKEDEAVHD